MSHLGIGIGYQSKNHSNPTMHLTVFWENLGKKVLISHARDVLINLFQDKILLFYSVARYVHCPQEAIGFPQLFHLIYGII